MTKLSPKPVIRLPDGLSLYLLDWVHAEYFEGTGMNFQSMKAWMNALGLPILYVGDFMYVEAINFSIAMRAALRVGQRSFLVPGCKPLSRGLTVPNSVRELDPLETTDTLKRCLAEMLMARRWDDKEQGAKLKAQIQALIESAQALEDIPAQVERARKRADFKNLAEFERKGYDIDIQPASETECAESPEPAQSERASGTGQLL